jgi:hypothetical protein
MGGCREVLVNCDDVDWVLIEESEASLWPSEVQEHVRGCRRCQELVHAVNIPAGGDPPSPAILRQIEQRLIFDLNQVRRVPPVPHLLALFAGIVICVLAFGVYRMGAFGIAVMSPLQAGAILVTLATGTGLLTYSLIQQMVPGSLYRISPRLLPIGIILSITIAVAAVFPFQTERNFWPISWLCIRAGTWYGLLAGVPFWLVLRRGAVLSPRTTGPATGVLAGLVGASVLEVHCPNLDAWHILTAHLGVVAICAIAGFIAGIALDRAASFQASFAELPPTHPRQGASTGSGKVNGKSS